MAMVVLLRGVNVGGNRTFRPAKLVEQLKHLDAVNIGAAGTFVVRKPIGQAALKLEFARRLPFATEIMVCRGRDLAKLAARDYFGGDTAAPDIMPFVSVLARQPKAPFKTPAVFPEKGKWLLKIFAIEGRFLIGAYRRQMKAIDYLGSLDKTLGVPVTTRNWNTLNTIVKLL